MKIITELKSRNIGKYNTDGIIFSYEKYNTIAGIEFKLDEVKSVVESIHSLKKLAILKIDKIIEEDEVEELYNFLDFILSYNIDYYLFTDMSVLNYFKTKKMENRLIYSAKTLNCSYNDCAYYNAQGIKVMLSNELTLDDIENISTLPNIVLDGYGYSNIFYSKRKLLSLFKEAKSLPNNITNKSYTITEQNRDENYPIYENENGTFIFTSYKYLFFKELEKVQNLFMFKIESLFIDEDALIEVIDIYKNAISEGITEEGYNRLIEIDKNVGHSFLYKKPLILRGDDNEKN